MGQWHITNVQLTFFFFFACAVRRVKSNAILTANGFSKLERSQVTRVTLSRETFLESFETAIFACRAVIRDNFCILLNANQKTSGLVFLWVQHTPMMFGRPFDGKAQT